MVERTLKPFRVAYSVFTHVNIYWTAGSKLMTILESRSNFCIIWGEKKEKKKSHTYKKGDLTDIGYKSTRKEITLDASLVRRLFFSYNCIVLTVKYKSG